ncbi:YceD family protein [Sphingomonas sp.]|uniref:YceD family protein n=1 Tax=Sphingomonas sp. TaxID=28214 RepID=UPI003B007EFA
MTPEFSRPERVDQIGVTDRAIEIAAADGERAGLARRFGLLAVDRLGARFSVRRDEAGIVATGTVTAAVTQACVATGEPLPAVIEEAVTLRFVERIETADDAELSEDALDLLPVEDGAIDLGEAAAATMALALDPFPRSPDADAALAEAGVKDEETARNDGRPFGGLADLKRKLEEG